MRRRFTLYTIIIICFLLLKNVCVGQNNYKYVPGNFMELGKSFDPLNPSNSRPFIIQFDTVKTPGYEILQYRVDVVKSKTQILDLLHFDAKASVKTLGYSFGGQISIDNHDLYSEENINILMTFRILYNPWRIDFAKKYLFSDWIQKDIESGDIKELVEDAGSQYIESIKKGALIYVLATVTNVKSETERQKSLKLTGKGTSGVQYKGETNLKSILNRASGSDNLHIQSNCIGGPNLINTVDLIDKLATDKITFNSLVETITEYLKSLNQNELPVFEFNSNPVSVFIDKSSNHLYFQNIEILDQINQEYIKSDSIGNFLNEILYSENKFKTLMRSTFIDSLNLLRKSNLDYKYELESLFHDCILLNAKNSDSICKFNKKNFDYTPIMSMIPSKEIFYYRPVGNQRIISSGEFIVEKTILNLLPNHKVCLYFDWSISPGRCNNCQNNCDFRVYPYLTAVNEQNVITDFRLIDDSQPSPSKVNYYLEYCDDKFQTDSKGNLNFKIKLYTECGGVIDKIRLEEGSFFKIYYSEQP